MRSRAAAWGAVAAYCALLFWLSSQPSTDLPIPSLFQFDKVLHMGAWFVLAVLTRRAVARTWVLEPAPLTFAAIAFAVSYGALDELHQGLGSAGRTADPYDLLADAIGATLGAATHALVLRRFR